MLQKIEYSKAGVASIDYPFRPGPRGAVLGLGRCDRAMLHVPADAEATEVRVFTGVGEHTDALAPLFDGGRPVTFRAEPGRNVFLPATVLDCPIVRFEADAEFTGSLVLRGEGHGDKSQWAYSQRCLVQHVISRQTREGLENRPFLVTGARSAQLHVPHLCHKPVQNVGGWNDAPKPPPPPPVEPQIVVVLASAHAGGPFLPLRDTAGEIVRFGVQPGIAVNLPRVIFEHCAFVRFQGEEGKDFDTVVSY